MLDPFFSQDLGFLNFTKRPKVKIPRVKTLENSVPASGISGRPKLNVAKDSKTKVWLDFFSNQKRKVEGKLIHRLPSSPQKMAFRMFVLLL